MYHEFTFPLRIFYVTLSIIPCWIIAANTLCLDLCILLAFDKKNNFSFTLLKVAGMKINIKKFMICLICFN